MSDKPKEPSRTILWHNGTTVPVWHQGELPPKDGVFVTEKTFDLSVTNFNFNGQFIPGTVLAKLLLKAMDDEANRNDGRD